MKYRLYKPAGTAQWVRRGGTGGPCNVAAWRSADAWQGARPPPPAPQRAFIASVAVCANGRSYALYVTKIFTFNIYDFTFESTPVNVGNI